MFFPVGARTFGSQLAVASRPVVRTFSAEVKMAACTCGMLTQEKKIQHAIVLANNTHTHLGPLEHKKSIISGIGNPDAKSIPMFSGLDESKGYYTSKSFLPKVRVRVRVRFVVSITVFWSI